MAKWLTKSDYVYGYLVSPALLWIKKHEPKRLPEIDEVLQARFEQGHELTELARQKFGGGVLIEENTLDSVKKSLEVLARAEAGDLVYEAAALADERLYARADIIKKNGNVWDMYEVKSATGYHRHEEYLLDLAFQKIVFERAGYNIGKLSLVLVNKHYKRSGEVEPDKLFYIEDVSDAIPPLLHRVEFGITQALQIIDNPVCPEVTPLNCSNIRSWLPIYEHLAGALPNESVLRLAYLGLATAKKLEAAGMESIRDIKHPDQFQLTPAQRGQWSTILAGEPTVHALKINHYFSKLRYPLYFLDYETVGPAIPLYENTRPYQTIPFQYSIQVLDEPGAAVRELKFLHQGRDNPMPALLEQLQQEIGETGSIIVWSDYERGAHLGMAACYPEHKEFLRAINKRLFDLMQVFRQQMYIDAGFFGSASIKKVLPVLVPELSYKDLAIGEGQTASLRWAQAITGKLGPVAAQKVFEDLITYCGQDTMAMVRIYQVLAPLAENAIGAPLQLPF